MVEKYGYFPATGPSSRQAARLAANGFGGSGALVGWTAAAALLIGGVAARRMMV